MNPNEDIDWALMGEDLGLTETSAEEFIHELAHMYDCIGEKAFDGLSGRGQNAVNELIVKKYGADDNGPANRAEIRVSAITQLTLQNLALLTKTEKKEIQSALKGNIRGEYSNEFIRLSFKRQLKDLVNINVAKRLAQWIDKTWTEMDYVY